MANIQICVINASTVLTDAEIAAALPVFQKQVDRDFVPAWGIECDLAFAGRDGKQPDERAWWIVVLDDSDQATAYGYHDVTKDGLPLGKVFAGTDIKANKSWTVTLSHELLEMLVDPEINLTVFDQSGKDNTGTLYAYEVCDACQSEDMAYEIEGVMVSNFVLPSWFEGSRDPGSTKFDFRNHFQRPFELAEGGYIGAFDILAGAGWQMKKSELSMHKQMRPAVGSRREKRRTLRSLWLRSAPQPVSQTASGTQWGFSKGYQPRSGPVSQAGQSANVQEMLNELMPVMANAFKPDGQQHKSVEQRDNEIREISRRLAPIVVGLMSEKKSAHIT